MICQSCGTTNAEDAPFCQHCGLPFTGASGSPFPQLPADALQTPPQPSPRTSPLPLGIVTGPDREQRRKARRERRGGCKETLILFGLIGLLALAWLGWMTFWNNVSGASAIATCSTQMTSLAGLAWSPDGSRIAAASDGIYEASVQIWNAENCQLLLAYNGQNLITALAWSPGGKYIASAGMEDGDLGGQISTVRIWDAENGRSVLKVAVSTVNALAWSPDGRYIVVAGANARGSGQVQVWDASSGKVMWNWLGKKGGAIEAVSWSPDGRRIAAGGDTLPGAQNSPIVVFNAPSGEPSFTFTGQAGKITNLAWSPNSKWIASTNLYFTAGYDYMDNEPIQVDSSTVQIWNPLPRGRVHSYGIDASDLAWSPDSQRIVLVNENVRVMDALTGDHVYAYRQGSITDNTEPVAKVAWSPDGTRVATASNELGDIEIWRPQGAGEFIGHVYVFNLLQVGVATIVISLAAFIVGLFAFRDKQETVRSRLGCSLGCGGCLLLIGALVVAGMVLFGFFVG